MFTPNQKQAKAKAEFHRRVKGNALLGPLEELPPSKLEQLSGVKCMDAWLKQDGFREWFINAEHNKDLLESAAELAIRNAILILEMPCDGEKGSPKPSDKLAAMKLILDYAGYSPKKDKDQASKENEIANMDEEALDKLIADAVKSGKSNLVKLG